MSYIRHSVIEQFSAELWREVFDYFNFNELWYTFHGLNKKIDGIVSQTTLHLNFEKKATCGHLLKNISNYKKKSNYGYFVEMILPSINVANIRSLKLREVNETKDFFSMYSLNLLVQLRLLSLDPMYSMNDNSFTFWNQLLSLRYLRSLKIKFGECPGPNNCIEEKEFIIRSIFNQEFCPLLESFIISTCVRRMPMPSTPFLSTTTRTTKIEYLSIDSLTFTDLMKLLHVLQNLRSFRMDYGLSSNESSAHQTMTIIMPFMPKCTRLHLKLFEEITFEHVEDLLKHAPNVKDLSIWGWYHLVNAKKWEMLLSIHCPKLIKFELICGGVCYNIPRDQARSDFREECAKTPFWVERNVLITNDTYLFGYRNCSDIAVRFNIKQSKQSMGLN